MESKQPPSFACPHCATRLRVGAKFFEPKTIPCPECQTELLVGFSDAGISVTLVDLKIDGMSGPTDSTDRAESLSALVKKLFASPRRASWIAGGVTGVVALIVVVAVFVNGDNAGDEKRLDGNVAQTHEIVLDSAARTPNQVANLDADAKQTSGDAVRVPVGNDSGKTTASTDVENPESASNGISPAKPSANGPREPVSPVPGPLPTIKGIADQGTSRLGDVAQQTNPTAKVPIQQVSDSDSNLGVANTNVSPANDERPVASIVVPKPKPLAERLAQPIASFKQASPVPLSALVEVVEELVQIDITFADSVAADLRETPVSLTLEKTTPREILEQAIARAKLQVVIGEQSIRLEPVKD